MWIRITQYNLVQEARGKIIWDVNKFHRKTSLVTQLDLFLVNIDQFWNRYVTAIEIRPIHEI